MPIPPDLETPVTSDCTISVLRDVLRVYDHRFLDLDRPQRDRLVEGTRRVLGDEGLSDAARAALPASYRLRAFCIQNGLREELERLIHDEVTGSPAGAVVVGGRVYALYPYLRGVPRQDADITAEIGVEHRLDAVGWHEGTSVRVRGLARLQRIETHRTAVDVILRERTTRAEHRVAARADPDGFEALVDMTAPGPGRWDLHVAATALGVSRESRFGKVRDPAMPEDPRKRRLGPGTEAAIYFTKGGYLAVLVKGGARPVPLRARIRRRLAR
ncbi:hypothetical protein GCM10009678_10230 [Actinomadura kijaniata]|uniref:Uncharacterized protein n=1 Tax=Actinomadura namibiensis TaxID=182080 RepID=A0A7W3LJB9_ACTNM|nr:hypothetical protein [Actinomadura namibiensis]MBA8949237.1 hypothetical protein [Actinomadura namibiensis]